MTERICSSQGCGRAGKLTRGMCAKCYRYWLDHTPLDQRGTAPRFARDFWSFVRKTHEHGCWTWTGITDLKGYGRWGRKIASRQSWELANGPILDGLWVLHHCDNPPCVNPRHLYLGTVVENGRDAATRGRAHRPRKSHCPQGHAKEGDNLLTVASGGHLSYRCRKCENERSNRRQVEARRARGLLKTRLSADEKTRICDLSQGGMSQRKIAAEVGRSLMAVQSALKEAVS
jgi:transposase-like protein